MYCSITACLAGFSEATVLFVRDSTDDDLG